MPLNFKQAIKNAIHACADASGDLYIRAGLGTPGQKINLFGDTSETGLAFTPAPKAMDCIVEGIADVVGQRRDVLVTSGLSNGSGGEVPAGSFLKVRNVANQFTLAQTDNEKLLGVAYEDIPNGSEGEVALSGIVDVRVVSLLSPSPGDYLYISNTAGQLTTAVTGEPVAICLNSSDYAGLGKVRAVLRILPA